MLKKYAPPENLRQLYIFGKTVFQMENFKRMLKSRSQYALAIGSTDIAARIAIFRFLNNGW